MKLSGLRLGRLEEQSAQPLHPFQAHLTAAGTARREHQEGHPREVGGEMLDPNLEAENSPGLGLASAKQQSTSTAAASRAGVISSPAVTEADAGWSRQRGARGSKNTLPSAVRCPRFLVACEAGHKYFLYKKTVHFLFRFFSAPSKE